ncbi:MAG: DUF1802 family protein [Myxococcales bacterium]|nr:DUF1802 family protein [Myxococcales bacterium]
MVAPLLSGDVALLIRRGGIHEPGFAVRGSHAVIFPTAFHDRGNAASEIAAKLPAAQAVRSKSATPQAASREGGVPLAAAVEIVCTWRVDSPDTLAPLAKLAGLTVDEVYARRPLKPTHGLWVLLVRAYPLTSPIHLPWHRSYGGCRSWITLHAPPPLVPGDPVLTEDALASVRLQVASLVGPARV